MRRLFSCWAIGALLCLTSVGAIQPAGNSFFYLTTPNGGGYFRIKSSAVAIASMTNAQKLSQSPSLAVGTEVMVTDGFVVSGFGDARDGFYFYDNINGGIEQSARYLKALPFLDDGSDIYAYYEHGWHLGGAALGWVHGPPDVGLNPWAVTYTGGLTPTYPAHQRYKAASTAHGGVFILGGDLPGIFTTQGSANGKPQYFLLGNNVPDGNFIEWFAGSWQIVKPDPDGVIYYSIDDVATPDLVVNWLNATDDSPASITVTSVTRGQLAAGLKIGADTYRVNGSENGRIKYSDVLGLSEDIHWSEPEVGAGFAWRIGDGMVINSGTVAFPSSGSPEVTNTRSDVASESNWEIVP